MSAERKTAQAASIIGLALTALQPADVAVVATTGNYGDLEGKPALGTAAAADAVDFATAAQGGLADTALQPSAIGNSVQAYDADIAAIAALVSAANKVPYATGAGTWALADFSAAGRALVDDADASAQRTTLGLAIGTNVQAYDADLTAIAALTSAANKAPYATGAGTWALMDVTSAGRALLDDADASAQRTTLGLGTAAVGTTGRDVSKILAYEDFGGFPTLNTDSRIIFRKPTPTNSDVYNVGILRNAPAGGTAGFVNSALRVTTTVDSVTTAFEWAGLFQLDVNAAGGGEHCALYAQATKDANGSAWSLCTELRETISNPTTGSLGIEVGMFVTGTDSSEMRHGIDISIGSADNLTGTNIVSSAIRIGPSAGDPARAQLTNGIQLKGRITAAIDMTQLDVSYSDVTVKMPTNGKIQWRDSNQTIRGSIAWNNVLSTFQVAGGLTLHESGASWPQLRLRGDASTRKYIALDTAGVSRWFIQSGEDAESGANAGSTFSIDRYSDAGTWLGAALSINRATGVVTVQNSLAIGGNQIVGARNTGWATWTGASNKNTTLDTGTATLGQVAQRLAAIQIALTTHGLLGA